MIKKYKLHLFIAILFAVFAWSQVWANCGGVLTPGIWNWTVASNCTVSNWLYSVWWDATVGTRTVTIASNAALVMNFNSKKMTFSTGKALMSGGGVIYGNISGYQWYSPAASQTNSTACPSWQKAWNPITRNFIPSGTSVNASYSWWAICKANSTSYGVCGTADGKPTWPAPSSNLCHAGSASAVTLSGGNYNWTCSSSTSVSCSAPQIYPGSCWSAQSGNYNANTWPWSSNSNLCSSGTSSGYTWSYGFFERFCGTGWGIVSCYRFDTSGGCFIAGTQVTLPDGSTQNIEDIKVGDKLLAREGVINTVQERFVIDYEWSLFSFNDTEHYFFTDSHPFLTKEGIWKSMNPRLSMQESPGLHVELLQVWDTVVLEDRELYLFNIWEKKNQSQTVYNFRLDGTHEYIADWYIVHNVEVKQ